MSLSNSPTRSRETLRTAAHIVVIVACGWWLLGEFAVVLRPLLIAVFLVYVLTPTYSKLRRRGLPAPLAIGFLAGFAVTSLVVVAVLVYANLLGLRDESSDLRKQAANLLERVQDGIGRLPAWTGGAAEGKRPDERLVELVPLALQYGVGVAFGGLLESAIAGLYLMFLLMGVERLPQRVRKAYPPEEAERMLDILGRMNASIISYLKAKVKSSLVFAVPVWFVLMFFGVKFAVLWAVLTFVCNFIPYIGSVVAYGLPTAFAVLQFGFGTQFVLIALTLLTVHVICATVVEPMLIGKAVGLSPLLVLAALAVWGLVWGLPGMVLAVPLTVVMKIVMENIDVTRPWAKLVEE